MRCVYRKKPADEAPRLAWAGHLFQASAEMRLRNAASFILKNFATPIVFYIVFEERGAKPAIAFAVAVAVLQVLSHLVFRWRFTPFFLLATGFTVLFGSMDLLIPIPQYFRLEAFAQNFTVGAIFLITLKTQRTMVWRLAMSLPEGFRPDLSQVGERYLIRVTQIWAVYFFVKSFAFLYFALHLDLGRLYVLRVLVGNGSALALIAGEIWYRKRRRS